MQTSKTVVISNLIFIVVLDLTVLDKAVFEPELEGDSWQLASVEGKHGNEFIFQGHQLLAKLCVETVKKPDEATELVDCVAFQ
jgi:hypothetical protein